jgi:hypothetical protein
MRTFWEITEVVDRQVLLISTAEFCASDTSFWLLKIEQQRTPKTLLVYGTEDELKRVKQRIQQSRSSEETYFQSSKIDNNLLEITFHAPARKKSA